MILPSFKLPLEGIHTAAMIVDENEKLIVTNEEFNKLAGIKGKDLPEISDLFDIENLEEFRSALRQMRGHSDKVMVGINLARAELTTRFLMTAVPISVKGVDAALVILSRGEGDNSIYTDYLTKLPNRQEAAIRLRYEWNRSVRAGTVFSLSLADIDHFKNINDTLGHEAGDQVLMHIAGILSEEIRGSDWCARWGGEEFMIFLNDSSAKEAEFVLNRVRTNIAQNPPIYQNSPVPVTLSFGLVSKGSAYKSYKDMVNDADVLLYESKNAGRNRVTLFETQGSPVAWNRKEIQAVVEDRIVHALFRPVYSRDGDLMCLEAVPSLPNMDGAQTRRLWQSADGLNLLKDLIVQLIESIVEEDGRLSGTREFVIPLPTKVAVDPQFLLAVRKAGVQRIDSCVLMLQGSLDLKEEAFTQLRELRKLGFRLAVRDIEINNIPLHFLTEQQVAYMFIKLDEVMRGESSKQHPIMKDLLESICEGGTKVIGVQRQKDSRAKGEFSEIVSGYLFRGEPVRPLAEVAA